MRPLFHALSMWGLVMLGQSALAQLPNTVQSAAKPLGLTPIGPVMCSGSDARSADFNARILPVALQVVNDNLQETVVFSGSTGLKLDSDKLFLWQNPKRPIRVYFVAEGTEQRNSIGYTMGLAGRTSPPPYRLLFPDVSSVGAIRTSMAPVQPGDFLQISEGVQGQQLDLFLICNGAIGGKTVLWNDDLFNSDRLQHIVAFALPDPEFILLGFEDSTGSGVLDYNDCVMVVDFGFDWQSHYTLPN